MSYCILIVDDDIELLKMLKSFLEMKGYEVITAENGVIALKKIERRPDLILLDINMPMMDGMAVCKRIRDKVSGPILFLTARDSDQDKVNVLLSGGDGYI